MSIGDFNQDGLSDIFFTGNMVPNKLYLNKGDFSFEDITEQAGVGGGNKWKTGAAVADVNQDGLPDIYVCVSVNDDPAQRANMLFINKGMNQEGIPEFEESAEAFGVADKGFSQNAAFLDYDLDGDLDLYVLTNVESDEVPSVFRPKTLDGSSITNDQLYRNNGDNTFSNVTLEAGIRYEGYGLGLAIADINRDGWPDIYVGNDYVANDLLYINNGDGTFTNKIKEILKHQSQFSMGNDIADINNDGLVDIITLDMLPEVNFRKKTIAGGGVTYQNYHKTEEYGYEYQYMRNMVHINNGIGPFSEQGMMIGLHQTEWSWSPLFMDVDNDGNRDLIVTNGFPKDLTDMDFVNFKRELGTFYKPHQMLDSIPVLKLANYAFQNHGNLSFTDATTAWGLTQPAFSNGAAFVDLDNDGDLDYVVNNINDEAFVYENSLYGKDKETSSANHYLRIKLEGNKAIHSALGAKITIVYEGLRQYHDHSTFRGYLSTVEDVVHFGLGTHALVDTVTIVWPDGNVQILPGVAADQLLTVRYEKSSQSATPFSTLNTRTTPLLKEVSSSIGIQFMHQERDKVDFAKQRTLPHKFSQAGPAVAVGDINGDGLEDFVVGGSSMYNEEIFIQQSGGHFSSSPLAKIADLYNEDEGILLFDADQDNDLDLYLVSGSYEYDAGHSRYQDRLYLNDGKGNFTFGEDALPRETESGSVVRAADFDQDGDLDLFVGGRVRVGEYPLPVRSFLFENNGGKFKDITREKCPYLDTLGMVTDALWTDVDNDQLVDLIIVGEFMPITLLKNDGTNLTIVTESGLEKHHGWWNSINGADFDKDGDTDYILGNMGLNNIYNITESQPLRAYVKDFDNNGSVDPILSSYIKSEKGTMGEYPVHPYEKLFGQSPVFSNQFANYLEYGHATMADLLQPYDLSGMRVLRVNNPYSSYIENLGNGKFAIHPLPREAQVAPVNGILAADIDLDGNLDIVLVGNDYGNEVFSGRLSGLNGLVLRGDGHGNFSALKTTESGFLVPGDAKALARLYTKQSELLIASQNRDSLRVYAYNRDDLPTGKTFVPLFTDVWAEVEYGDGRKEKIEFYHGSGYLSQSTRSVTISEGAKKVTVYSFDKNTSRVLNLEVL